MRFLRLESFPGGTLVSKIYSGFWLSRTRNRPRESTVLLVPKLALAILEAVVPGVAIANCFDAKEDENQAEWLEAMAKETIQGQTLDGSRPHPDSLQIPSPEKNFPARLA